MDKKRVYTFGNGQAEGKADMRNLLGGKGANLAEMNLIGVPVPPGFTITTEVCTEYYEMGQDKVVALLKNEVEQAIAHVETLMRSKFGDVENPANSYQTIPFLKDQIKNKGYKFDQAFKTVAYPMGVYSKKIKSLKDLKDGDSIAVPNDASNETRGLQLFEKAGIIKLKKGVGQTATKKDVVSNPKHLKIIELEASQLPKQLGEVTAAAINTNFAMGAGLSINENAIFHEPLKNNPYPNVFVVQSGHKNDAVIKKIDKYYHSKQTAAFIKKEFKGSVVLSSSK